jgi:hypothetical protein
MSEGSVSATRCTGRGWRGRPREPWQWRLGRFRSGTRPVLDKRTPELRHCAHDLERAPSIGGNRLRGHDGPGAASPGVLVGARRLVGAGEWFGRFVGVGLGQVGPGGHTAPRRLPTGAGRDRRSPQVPLRQLQGRSFSAVTRGSPAFSLWESGNTLKRLSVTGAAAAAIFAAPTVTDAGAASGACAPGFRPPKFSSLFNFSLPGPWHPRPPRHADVRAPGRTGQDRGRGEES